MTEEAYPLEMELLNAVVDDSESLHTIIRHHWPIGVALPRIEDIVQCLRDLQEKGWVQCYRLDDDRYLHPLGQFPDEEALSEKEVSPQATLWWGITDRGRDAHDEYFQPGEPSGINDDVAQHILDVVSKGQMSARLAIEKWPVLSEAPWPEAAQKAYGILERLASAEESGSDDMEQRRMDLKTLEGLANEEWP